jgi:hypothetical protein
MKRREDFDVLAELWETIAQKEQQAGFRPSRSHISSTELRIAEFARKCKDGELTGRNRKRQAHNLLLEVLRSFGR